MLMRTGKMLVLSWKTQMKIFNGLKIGNSNKRKVLMVGSIHWLGEILSLIMPKDPS